MITRRQLFVLGLVMIVVVLWMPRHAVLHASNVRILSIGEHDLVVSRTVNGKTEQVRFTVRPETVRSGILTVGARVAVHYVIRNHENIATSVQLLPRS